MREVLDEEWVVVLSHRWSNSTATVVEAVGTSQFTLVEVLVDETDLSWGDCLYVGPGSWTQVRRVRRLSYQTLTTTGQQVLRDTVAGIVHRNEPLVVSCFNTAYLVGYTGHSLDLLSGLDRDCRDAIRQERKQRRFADLADLIRRVDCLDHPQTVVVRRVMAELQADKPYRWLTHRAAQSWESWLRYPIQPVRLPLPITNIRNVLEQVASVIQRPTKTNE